MSTSSAALAAVPALANTMKRDVESDSRITRFRGSFFVDL